MLRVTQLQPMHLTSTDRTASTTVLSERRLKRTATYCCQDCTSNNQDRFQNQWIHQLQGQCCSYPVESVIQRLEHNLQRRQEDTVSHCTNMLQAAIEPAQPLPPSISACSCGNPAAVAAAAESQPQHVPLRHSGQAAHPVVSSSSGPCALLPSAPSAHLVLHRHHQRNKHIVLQSDTSTWLG